MSNNALIVPPPPKKTGDEDYLVFKFVFFCTPSRIKGGVKIYNVFASFRTPAVINTFGIKSPKLNGLPLKRMIIEHSASAKCYKVITETRMG